MQTNTVLNGWRTHKQLLHFRRGDFFLSWLPWMFFIVSRCFCVDRDGLLARGDFFGQTNFSQCTPVHVGQWYCEENGRTSVNGSIGVIRRTIFALFVCHWAICRSRNGRQIVDCRFSTLFPSAIAASVTLFSFPLVDFCAHTHIQTHAYLLVHETSCQIRFFFAFSDADMLDNTLFSLLFWSILNTGWLFTCNIRVRLLRTAFSSFNASFKSYFFSLSSSVYNSHRLRALTLVNGYSRFFPPFQSRNLVIHIAVSGCLPSRWSRRKQSNFYNQFWPNLAVYQSNNTCTFFSALIFLFLPHNLLVWVRFIWDVGHDSHMISVVLTLFTEQCSVHLSSSHCGAEVQLPFCWSV